MCKITRFGNKKASASRQMRIEVSIVYLILICVTLPPMALPNRYKGLRFILTLSKLLPWLIYKAKKRLYGTLRVEC